MKEMTRNYTDIEEQIDATKLVQQFLDKNSHEFMNQIGLFINRQMWCRFMFFYEMYQRILNVHGSVAEFGVRWGQNLVLFENFRGMMEPFNHNRKIVGFDTFEGFPSISEQDGDHELIEQGGYGVWRNYEQDLEQLLQHHENQSPNSHIKKFELVKGDVLQTLDQYLDENPHTMFALVYFDMDLYEPTLHCLNRIRDRLGKGAVVGFDELNHPSFPGETRAVQEALGIHSVQFHRSQLSPHTSYIVL